VWLLNQNAMEIDYKKPFQKVNGVCLNCGRSAPPCKCGEAANLECSTHLEPMRVLAIPVYATPQGEYRHIAGWVNAAECPVVGCGKVRSIKYGQGVDRNQNRKTGRL
jgi:hypothetical protein